MGKASGCALVICLFAATQPSLTARDVPLVAGNLFQCTLDEPDLSSQTLKVGDPIVCYARPAHILDCSLFPSGSEWAGQFAAFKAPGRLGGKGWIKIDFNRLILPDGIAPVRVRVISVSGFKVDAEGRIRGRDHPRRDEADWSDPFLWSGNLVTLPEQGPLPARKGERTVTLRLLDNVRLPCWGPVTSWPEGEWRHFGSSLSPNPLLQPFDSFRSVFIPFGSTSGSTAQSSLPDRSNPGSAPRDGEGASNASQKPYAGPTALVPVADHSLQVRPSWPTQPGPQTSRSPSSLHADESPPHE